MIDSELEKLKYPIGRFVKPTRLSSDVLSACITNIEEFPRRLEPAVTSLSDEQLDTQYRPGGWTIRQVVHHVADSHMNSYTRFKLALTEDKPTIKPYFEDRWAELIDGKTMPVEVSLNLLEGLHARWTVLLKSLSNKELKKTLVHPARGQEFELEEYIAEYSWHCRHHLAHITNLRKRKGW
jgi:hypothetical protein